MELDELVTFTMATTNIWGSLPTWILVVVALLVAWRVTRGGAGSAVSELSTANRVLDTRIHALGAEVRDLKIENGELRTKTDVSIAIAPLVAWSEKHEQRAAERHEKMLVLMDLIAQRLGPDDGHSEAA